MKRVIDTTSQVIIKKMYSKCSSSWLDLNKNKANGYIPTKTLKTISRATSVPLNALINSAVVNSVFPL